MASMFRLAVAAAALGQMSCSATSSDVERGATSSMSMSGSGNAAGGSAGAISEPSGAGAPSGVAGSSGEGLPDPALVTGTSDAAIGSGGSSGTDAAPMEGENPVLGEPSGLPSPGPAGVPRPSGAAANLRVLAWAGFRAAVSYTFDDSNSSQINNYAQLQGLGVPMTFYLQTGKGESNDPIWAQAVLDGHELGNHTASHQSTGPNIAADTDAATAFIETRFGVTVRTMAAPNGSIAYADVARTRFLINRGVNDRLIAPNDESDPFNLPCYIPPTGASTAAFNAKVDAARNAGSWQVVLVHGFTGGTDGAYQAVGLADFTSSVGYAKAFGDVWIDSLLAVAAYWRAQKMFAGITPTSAGDATTWSWTLPANFPPKEYLRVSVDGGTLSQAGAALAWDEHGYYELALDAGSVTLSP